MIIGGLEKNSYIDFPGKVSCVLFLSRCNFRCPYCQNPDLVEGNSSASVDLKAFFSFLARRKNFIDGVVISGGEPTLQPDLLSLCQRIKAMGYAVKLDTNGSRPNAIKSLLDKGVLDYLAMDIKTDPRHYSPLICSHNHHDSILESIRLILDSGLPHEFRSTCVRPFINAPVVAAICQHINGADFYALQRFNRQAVLSPSFFEGKDREIDREEMSMLQKIVLNSGIQCIVR